MILEEDEAFLAHYGVKGMHWGIRKSTAGGTRERRFNKAIRGGHHGTPQTRAARNIKRGAAFLIASAPGLLLYNAISAPLKEGSKVKTQSKAALYGKTFAASILTTPLGGLLYYQMSAPLKSKKSKKSKGVPSESSFAPVKEKSKTLKT